MLDDKLIQPIKSNEVNQPAKRPIMGGLDISKSTYDLDVKFMDIENGLNLLKTKYQY
jgi:dTDP-4-dehydrorhamnose reductase